MTEVSTVILVHNNQVTLGCTTTSCASCAGNSFCNIKAHTYKASKPEDMKLSPGDQVRVFLPPGKTIFSGFVVLIFPLILFFVGFLMTGAVFEDAGEGLKSLGGFIGLSLGFVLGYLFGRWKKRQYMPVIKEKIP